MDFDELKASLLNAEWIQTATQLLKDKNDVKINNLSGSLTAFLMNVLQEKIKKDIVIILPEKEAAAYCYNDFQNIVPKKGILFFPDSFKKPRSYEAINKTNIQQRTEVINKLVNSDSKKIVITYPEALLEKVVKTESIKKNSIRIKTNEKLDVDFLMDVLVEYGFEREDFVLEPGQFAIRGDIVDVFSFGNEFPYRIELFDDEVESIRLFDPTSQLSTKKISLITIIPNFHSQAESSEHQPFFKLFKKDTICYVKDIETINDYLLDAFERCESFEENDETEEEVQEFFREKLYENPTRIISGLEQFRTIESGVGQLKSAVTEINYKSSPQPSFNKNFQLIAKNWQENTGKGYKNYLFSENSKQIERFYSIFEDLELKVEFTPISIAIHEGFIDHEQKTACYTDHQIFERYHKFKIRQSYNKSISVSLKALKELQPGDFVTHIDHGVGRFSGLEKIEVNGNVQESVRLIYRDNDILYVGINSLHKISKYVGKEGKQPKIHKLGSDAWESVKRKTKRNVKDIAQDLIKLYAKRKASKGFAFAPDTYLQAELEASFIYEDTPDQFKATQDVKMDMEKITPMDRLVCGDVGFGKTEVAIRAAFKAVADSKQVAILVPTTILAFQHYKTFAERLKDMPCRVDYINRFRTAKEKTQIKKDLKEGKIDILIGTHAILSKAIEYKDLGLMIIDEEQKFGVGAKEKLRQKKANIDTLTLTATPIPRTMQFSLMAARDLSTIDTPPPNRQPVHTEIRALNEELIRDAIEYEIYRGGQVFFVHNRVKDLPDIKSMLQRIIPDVDIAMAHGQMEGKAMEKVFLDFMDKKYDILLCTNIVESGVDIPNVNTIIINNAHWFGLSDLHQLRGRVGRSNKKAFCYLFAPPMSSLTSESRKRLQTIEQFSDLGSGFQIAMRDLDIRGAGNMLGGEQSGFMVDIGYNTYHKILDEAIQELKETEFKDLFKEETEKEDKVFVRDCQIDTDLEIMIPDAYVNSIQERLSLYTRLDNIVSEEGLERFAKELEDRFGKIPNKVNELFNALRLRWIAKKIGFERVIFKNKTLRGYFPANPTSAFYESKEFHKVLGKVQQYKAKAQLKQTTKYLTLAFTDVKSMVDAAKLLNEFHEA